MSVRVSLRITLLITSHFALEAQAVMPDNFNPVLMSNNSFSHGEWFRRSARSVIQFTHVIRCYTSCEPLRYKRYGCYCGFKGSGRPVDVIDSCCKNHDRCYSRIPCPSVTLYILRYAWACLRPGQAVCGTLYNQWLANRCAYQLCECDRIFSSCISKFSCPPKKAICWSNPIITLANILF